MNKEDLIHKWMNDSLSSEEHKAFMSMPEYQSLSTIRKETDKMQAPALDKESMLASIVENNKKASETKEDPKVTPIWKYISSAIAASLIFLIGWQIIQNNDITDIHTTIEEELAVELPDGSSVILRENSNLTYADDWSSYRQVKLDGEAYFNVINGSTFQVTTTHGKVSVLGTQFSVRSENNDLTVICDEGSVKVEVDDSIYNAVLLVNHSYHLSGDALNHISDTETRLKNYEYKKAALAIENIYQVKIEEGAWLARGLVNCNLPHDDLVAALDALYIPFNVNYDMSEDGVISISE